MRKYFSLPDSNEHILLECYAGIDTASPDLIPHLKALSIIETKAIIRRLHALLDCSIKQITLVIRIGSIFKEAIPDLIQKFRLDQNLFNPPVIFYITESEDHHS